MQSPPFGGEPNRPAIQFIIISNNLQQVNRRGDLQFNENEK